MQQNETASLNFKTIVIRPCPLNGAKRSESTPRSCPRMFVAHKLSEYSSFIKLKVANGFALNKRNYSEILCGINIRWTVNGVSLLLIFCTVQFR